VQRLLLGAALDAFAREGFAGAATRRIAQVAGVNEPLVFRYFGSKSGLYEAAVLEHGPDVIETLRRTDPLSRFESPGPAHALAWVRHVDSVIELHKTQIVALLNHGLPLEADPDLDHRVRSVRQALFGALEDGAAAALGVVDAPSHFRTAVRATFAMLIGMSAYGTSLFELPPGEAPAAARREETTRMAALTLLSATGRLHAKRQSGGGDILGT
jgi:AcrR family transcriptional regulator